MNLYEEYAVLEDKIKTLTLMKEQKRDEILSEMAEKGEKKVTTEVGSFTVAKLKSWEYPEEVIELGEEFKAAKAHAESVGTAKYTEKDSLRFTKITL